MAHAFIQAFDDETEAFLPFARSRPSNLTLLIDTYDTEAGARKVVALAAKLAAEGIEIRGVRLDSGDLLDLSRKVRAILDGGGPTKTQIFASGGLDEDALQPPDRRRRAHRRLRYRHQPHHLFRPSRPRLCLQAAGIRRPPAAQAIERQGHLARPQAGLRC
jgi:Nicotinic acid phosphoribosyltransferase